MPNEQIPNEPDHVLLGKEAMPLVLDASDDRYVVQKTDPSDSLGDKFQSWLNRPPAERAEEILARQAAHHAALSDVDPINPLKPVYDGPMIPITLGVAATDPTVRMHNDVLREAVRAAADRARDKEDCSPEQAAVAVVTAFQAAQKQLSAAVSDDAVFGVLGRIRVDVLADGLLHVRSYIDGKCDSSGLYFPREAGPAISKTIQEVRDAVASRVVPR